MVDDLTVVVSFFALTSAPLTGWASLFFTVPAIELPQAGSAQSVKPLQSLSNPSAQFVSVGVFAMHFPATAASQTPAALSHVAS